MTMAAAAEVDHYQVLELSPDAQLIDIKKAYRRLALKHHPDRNGGSAASTARFKEISTAYTILSDEARRREYDLSQPRTPPRPATACHPAAAAAASPRASPPRGSPATTPTRRRKDKGAASWAASSRDPRQQFDDLFTNDPFFRDAFSDMDGAFAQRFARGSADQARDDADAGASASATSWESVGPAPFCGLGKLGGSPKRQGAARAAGPAPVPWGEWLMNKLGIEVSVTSISHKADGSVVASAYTSKTNSKRKSRTYVENGRQVSVVSMEKNGNRIEDKFVEGRMVERRVNGKVEATPEQVVATR